jgi:rRNA maturation RNase YbeY
LSVRDTHSARAILENVAVPSRAAARDPDGFPAPDDIERQALRAIETLCAIDRLGPCGFGATILIVDDAAIAELNGRYRGKAAPTDVLSFPLLDFPPGPGTAALAGDAAALGAILHAWPAPSGAGERTEFEGSRGTGTEAAPHGDAGAFEPGAQESSDAVFELGDVVISYETCVRQAGEIGHSVRDEFQRLLVHGILHLFGYDHETSAADEELMREREDRLLAALA